MRCGTRQSRSTEFHREYRAHSVTADRVEHRMSPIPAASTTLGRYAQALIHDAVARGYLAERKS